VVAGKKAKGEVAISEAGSLVWIQILVDFELPMMPEECLGSEERAAQFVYSSSGEAPFMRTVMRYWRFGTNDSCMSPCPTTSRPRDIPAETIRQQQTDLSLHISLRKSLRGCGAPFSEEPSQVDRDPLICLASRQLDANRGKINTRPPLQGHLRVV
jgi:hypothetical protein